MEREAIPWPEGIGVHHVLVNRRYYRELMSTDKLSQLKHIIIRGEYGQLSAVDWHIGLDPNEHVIVPIPLARDLEREVQQRLTDLASWWPFKKRSKNR